MNERMGSQSSHSSARKLVFIVDDEPLILELAVAILEPLGHLVKTFRTADAALEAFTVANSTPDLVISDYAMPGMDGLTFIDECRRLVPGQKTMVLSGTVDQTLLVGKQGSPDAFLAKPFQPKQLMQAVQNLIGPPPKKPSH
jgi:CheY-like chemotaxis protein